MPSKRTPDSVVSFKGFSGGILLSLALEDFDFDKVIRKAISIYKRKQSFFGSNVALYATGFHRELTDDEGGMVRKMFDYLLKKEVFTYRETSLDESISFHLEEKQPLSPSSINDSSSISSPASVQTNDPNEFLVIGKNVRAGVVVQSPGNIIVFGDIHTGAKVLAGKSLYVFGVIKGEVGFGNDLHCNKAILACKELKAITIKAGDRILEDSIITLDPVPVPIYIYYNEGEVSIVKISKD